MGTAARQTYSNEPRLNRNQAFIADANSLSPPVLLRFPNVTATEEKAPPGPAIGQTQVAQEYSPASMTTASAFAPPPSANRSTTSSQPEAPAVLPMSSGSSTATAVKNIPVSNSVESSTDRSWSERIGSRLALIMLLAAVAFGAFVAMKGQQGVEKLPPMADDFDISIDDGAVAPPSSRPNPALGDQPKPQSDQKDSETLNSVSQADTQKSFDETLADIAKFGPSGTSQAQDSESTETPIDTESIVASQSTTDMPNSGKPVESDIANSNSPEIKGDETANMPSQSTLSTPVAVYSPPKETREPTPNAVAQPTNSATNSATSSIATNQIVSYPTTAFPNPIDWNRYFGNVSQATASHGVTPRVAVRPEDARATISYPTTAWPNAPSTGVSASNNAVPPNNTSNLSPVITR